MAVFNAYSGTWTLRLTVTESNVNIENNTSVLTFTLQLISGGYDFSQYGVGASITVDGQVAASRNRYSSPQLSCGVGATLTLISGATYTVYHNNDGSKQVSIGFTLDMAKAYYTPGAMSSSGNALTLTTIPRATTPSVPASMIMGQAYPISLSSRASSGFTHTLIYEFGNSSSTIVSKTSSTSVSWTPPLSLANQIPSATKGTGTITCHTYSGSTLIGTKEVSFSLSVPSSVKPSVNSISHSETVSNLNSKFGGYVQSKSKIKISVSASGIYGSSISGCSAVVDGVSYAASKSGNYWVFTTDPIDKSGYIPISVTVTDSRGRSSGATDFSDIIRQLAYSNPTITKFNVARINESGELFDEGKRLKIEIQYTVSSVDNKNTVEVAEILYKRKTETLWDNLNFIPFGSPPYSLNGVHDLLDDSYPEFSIDYGYDIQLRIGDYFTESNPITLSTDIPTDIVLLDLRSTGKGVGIGMVSQKDAMEVAMPVEFLEEITADVDKTPFAAKSHTHNYAGSSSPGGAATYANYLNIMHSNEIRFSEPTNAIDLYFNWKFANGNSAAKINNYSFYNGNQSLSTLKCQNIYAISLGRVTLFSGTWSSGSITLSNARKFTSILLYGKPASDETNTSLVLPTGLTGTVQFCSNIAYFTFRIASSGTYDLTLTMASNPDSGSIIQVIGLTQYRA